MRLVELDNTDIEVWVLPLAVFFNVGLEMGLLVAVTALVPRRLTALVLKVSIAIALVVKHALAIRVQAGVLFVPTLEKFWKTKIVSFKY